MKLSNAIIYDVATKLRANFPQDGDMSMPIKLYFYLQKNIEVLFNAASEIDKSRLLIAKTYGTLNPENNVYDIPPDQIERASNELRDLFELEQELPIHMFKLEDFEGLEFTFAQMNALMLMIEE